MRDAFPGYYRPSEDEFRRLWEEALFSFDANVLLGLYRYSTKTRTLFFRNVARLGKRVWLTHQAALEYQRNRAKTILDQQSKYQDVLQALDRSRSQLRRDLQVFEQRHTYLDPSEIIHGVSVAVDKAKASVTKLREKHPDFLEDDPIRDRLERLFKGRVGPAYSGDVRERALEEAAHRIELRIPPGFADSQKEGERSLGDALIWLQLLDKVKNADSPVIFVTDDRKEDWWEMVGGRTLGPRPELLQELHDRAGVGGYLYDSSQFIRRAQEFLALGTEAEARAAAEEVEEAQAEAPQDDTSLTALMGLLLEDETSAEQADARRRQLERHLVLQEFVRRWWHGEDYKSPEEESARRQAENFQALANWLERNWEQMKWRGDSGDATHTPEEEPPDSPSPKSNEK